MIEVGFKSICDIGHEVSEYIEQLFALCLCIFKLTKSLISTSKFQFNFVHLLAADHFLSFDLVIKHISNLVQNPKHIRHYLMHFLIRFQTAVRYRALAHVV